MNTDFLQVTNGARLDELISRASVTSHAGHVELLRAARDGTINVAFIDRHADAPMKALERAIRPVVVVLGDDDYASTGPTGWPSWRRLKYWARAGLIHATAGDAASYSLAVTMALVQPRMLLIETDTDHARQWGDALFKHGIKAIGLLPRDGDHPVLPDKGEVQ